MKRIALIGLMLATAGALFANGASEIDRDPVWNPVEITGTVSIVEDYPVLTARGTTYLLGAPRAAWYVDDIEEGQTITIRGHLVEEPRVGVDIEVDAHIAVDQAVVDGEVIALGFRGATIGRAPAIASRGGMTGRGGPAQGPMGRGGMVDRDDAYRRPYYGEPDDDRPYGDFRDDTPGPRGRW